jgi:hypothetical protein
LTCATRRFNGIVLGVPRALIILERTMLSPYRDSVTRFSTSGFFHASGSPKPLNIQLGAVPNFFRKFTEIFAIQDVVPPVSLTPVANGKNLKS